MRWWWRHRRCAAFTFAPHPDNGQVVTWPCGQSVWLGKRTPWYLRVDEARAIHDRLTRPRCS